MSPCRAFPFAELKAAQAAALASLRKRKNVNVHPQLDDTIQRFFNCLEPETYVRPHRHAPGKFELFVLLSGAAGVLLFDQQGGVTEKHLLAPEAAVAVEIPGGALHTVVALAPHTVLFEVKPGPYEPLTDKDFAPWAPAEGDERSHLLRTRWQALFTPGPTGCT